MRSFWAACCVVAALAATLCAGCADFTSAPGRSSRYRDPAEPEPEPSPRDAGMTKVPPTTQPPPGQPAPAPPPGPGPAPAPPPAPPPNQPPPAADAATPPPPPPAPADAGPAPGLPPEPPGVTPFPAGPYGFRRGQTVDNLDFTQADGTTLTFEQIRSDPSVKAIIWASGAMWCGACRAETAELVDIAERSGARGVFVMQSMFEDSDGSPSDARTAETLQRESGGDGSFHALAEPSPPHYSGGAIPTIWVIDAETMQVVSFEIGGDPGLEDTALSVVRSSSRR